MALPPLHKNSCSSERILQLGRTVISIALAEDPETPLINKRWGFQNKEGNHQTNMVFMVGTELFELSDGHIARGVQLIIGPLKISAIRV